MMITLLTRQYSIHSYLGLGAEVLITWPVRASDPGTDPGAGAAMGEMALQLNC